MRGETSMNNELFVAGLIKEKFAILLSKLNEANFLYEHIDNAIIKSVFLITLKRIG